MFRTPCLPILLVLAGCISMRREVQPIALPGSELRAVQSRYQELGTIHEFYTNAAEVRIDVHIAEAQRSLRQAVLWFRETDTEQWRRGPVSPPDDRWISFAPPEGRYMCRFSAIYSDGSEDLIPREDSPPCFHLVVDRSRPTIKLAAPETVLANTTTTIRFEILDSGLAPSPTAELYFSPDRGKSWERVGVIGVEFGENSYGWRVPDRVGRENLLRLVCRDLAGNEAETQIETPFAILPHPTSKEALLRLIHGVSKEGKAEPLTEPDRAPPSGEKERTKADQPDSAPTHARAEGPRLAIEAPEIVRAGQEVPVRVIGVPAGTQAEALRLLFRSAAGEPWQPANAASRSSDGFLWTVPQKETFQARLRVELAGAGGAIASTCESKGIAIDATPPALSMRITALPDQQVYRVQASARDAGTGTDWIKLFVTRDGGNSWEEFAHRAKPEVEEMIRRELVAIGLHAQSQDRVGNASPAPAAGRPPAHVIPPLSNLDIELNELGQRLFRGGERVDLTWHAKGSPPPGGTAVLALRRGEALPWESYEAVDLMRSHHLWEAPAETTADLWLRLELRFPGKVALVSNAIGPYAIDSDPPLLTVGGTTFLASSIARLPVVEANAGPAEVSGATLYIRRKGESSWQALSSTYEGHFVSAPCLSVPEGTYEVYVRARDALGQEGPAPEAATPTQATLAIDKTPPRIRLKLAETYFEGTAGEIAATVEEACAFTLLVQAEGEKEEVSLATCRLPPCTSTIRFRPPPALRRGLVWARGVDEAGNREETERHPIAPRSAAQFIAPHGGEAFSPGQEVTVECWIHPELVKERPNMKLWWLPSKDRAGELIAESLEPQGTFRWAVPDRCGPGNSLRMEIRIEGVLRAVAELQGTFEIRARNKPPPPPPPKVAEVDPRSSTRGAEGLALLANLEKAIQTGEAAKIEELREQSTMRFRAALAIDSGNGEAYFGLSQLCLRPYAQREDLAAAEGYLASAVNADPTLTRAWFQLGVTRVKLRKFLEAERALVKAIDLEDSTRARYNLGLALLRQEKYAPALTEFQRAASDAPPILIAYDCMVECWARQGNPAKAREVLREGIARGAISEDRAREWEAFLKGS